MRVGSSALPGRQPNYVTRTLLCSCGIRRQQSDDSTAPSSRALMAYWAPGQKLGPQCMARLHDCFVQLGSQDDDIGIVID